MNVDMIKLPYSLGYGSDQKWYVDGPGNGTGYYSGTLWPEMRFSNEDDAKAAVKVANEAYRAGYQQAQSDIRKALGS